MSVSLVFCEGLSGEGGGLFLGVEFCDEGVAFGFPFAPFGAAVGVPEGLGGVFDDVPGVGGGAGVLGVVSPFPDDFGHVVGAHVEFEGEFSDGEVGGALGHGVLVSGQ